MKNAFLPLSILALSGVLSGGCTKETNKVFTTNFYTRDSGTALYLYVDEVYQGKLSYFSGIPACGVNNSDGPKALSMTLHSGEYRVVGKDSQGKVVSASLVTLGAAKMGASGNIGGLRLDDNGSCLAIGLFR